MYIAPCLCLQYTRGLWCFRGATPPENGEDNPAQLSTHCQHQAQLPSPLQPNKQIPADIHHLYPQPSSILQTSTHAVNIRFCSSLRYCTDINYIPSPALCYTHSVTAGPYTSSSPLTSSQYYYPSVRVINFRDSVSVQWTYCSREAVLIATVHQYSGLTVVARY